MLIIARVIVFLLLLFPSFAAAHSGGLNAQGCHNNHKTGGYHCHRGQSGLSNAIIEQIIQKLDTSGLTKNEKQNIIEGAVLLEAIGMSDTFIAISIINNIEKAKKEAKTRAWLNEYGLLVSYALAITLIIGWSMKNKSAVMGLLFALSAVGLFCFLGTWAVQAAEAQDIPPYNRASFGRWLDADNDCQNTRAEILIELSSAPVTFATAKHCRVVSGRWQGA